MTGDTPPSRTSISARLATLARAWAQSQYELIVLAVELADSAEWILAGSPTPAHHVAEITDVEPCTAREWLRVGKRVRGLPVIAEFFASGTLSYSKVRALVPVATPDNEAELASLAVDHSAGELRVALASWMNNTMDSEELEAYQQQRRSVSWRTESDGMVTFTLRLPPIVASILIALLATIVMRSKPRRKAAESWPSLAQQHADAVEQVLANGAGQVVTEVVVHVRGDGCTTDDGTPIADTVVGQLLPASYIRALIHDADRRPINASGRQRHPSVRQRRVIKERDRACIDCGRATLLEYDHCPDFEQTGHTIIDELELRCAPCHTRRHAIASS